MKNWTVITVTYNSRKHLEAHWRSQADRQLFDWVVIDNGSTDGSVEVARELADHVIESGENVGFSRGNNLGLQVTPRDNYVAFVNPDVRIEGTGWTDLLAHTIDDHRAIVAPQLLNADGSLQANARGIPFLRDKIRNRLSAVPNPASRYARAGFDEPVYCAWVMGAALAGRAETFRTLGGWNERFFLYYEDHEMGLRSWAHDVPVVIDPAVRWTHEWARATIRPDPRAWRCELDSAWKFYSSYPALATGPHAASTKLLQRRNLATMERLLWTPATPARSQVFAETQTTLPASA